MKQKSDFVKYLWEQVNNGSVYLYGGQGEDVATLTPEYIHKRDSDDINFRDMLHNIGCLSAWKKAKCFDCSGLIVYWLINNGLIDKDTTANGLCGMCKKKSAGYLLPGDLAFQCNARGKAYHVGVYVGNGVFIEANSSRKGVIAHTDISKWDCFGTLELDWE